MTRPELRGLTGLRGIAAWLVVLYHLRTACLPSIGRPMFDVLAKGYLAVDLFFLLSGFVLWLNYAERLRVGGVPAGGRFLLRRAARLWPLHLVALAFTVTIAIALAATGRHAEGFPWATLPLHVVLIQNWGLTHALDWNVPDWSISAELGASLLMPLIALAHWERRRTGPLLATLALLAAGLFAVFAAAGADRLSFGVPMLGLPRCLIEFTAGGIVCALWRRWRHLPGAGMLALAIAAAALGAAAIGVAPETLLVPAGFAALLTAAAIGDARNPLGRPLPHYLGEISYAVYIIHFPLFFAFKLAFVHDAWDMPLWQLGLFLTATLLVSAGLHHLIELPAQQLAGRLLKRAPPRRAHATVGA